MFEVLMNDSISLAASFEADSPANIFPEAKATALDDCEAVTFVLEMAYTHALRAQVTKYGIVYLTVLMVFVLLVGIPCHENPSCQIHPVSRMAFGPGGYQA